MSSPWPWSTAQLPRTQRELFIISTVEPAAGRDLNNIRAASGHVMAAGHSLPCPLPHCPAHCPFHDCVSCRWDPSRSNLAPTASIVRPPAVRRRLIRSSSGRQRAAAQASRGRHAIRLVLCLSRARTVGVVVGGCAVGCAVGCALRFGRASLYVLRVHEGLGGSKQVQRKRSGRRGRGTRDLLCALWTAAGSDRCEGESGMARANCYHDHDHQRRVRSGGRPLALVA
jgi:hypothetical protein